MELQRTDKWFDDRLGNVTASMFKVIMSGPTTQGWRDYRLALAIERIKGERAQGYSSPAMKTGTEREPLAKKAYIVAAGFPKTEEVGFIQHPIMPAGASPDLLVEDDGMAEFKCPTPAVHAQTLKMGRMPKGHMAQVQGQMWITGRKWNDFVSFNPEFNPNAQLFIERQFRDETYIAELERLITLFVVQVEEEYNFLKEYKPKWQHQLTA